MGGRRLFAELGLAYREYDQSNILSVSSGDVLLVHGAGVFCGNYPSMARVVQSVAHLYEKIVILPSTIVLNSEYFRGVLASIAGKTTVYCRELWSYQALQASGIVFKGLELGHDLAFHCDFSNYAHVHPCGSCAVFREDAEGLAIAPPRGIPRCDASLGSHHDPVPMIEYVAQHEVIHSSRLHAAVVGAMLGRRVFLYPNSYFKNLAVFEHSLRHFPGVSFVDNPKRSLYEALRLRVSRSLHNLHDAYWRLRGG